MKRRAVSLRQLNFLFSPRDTVHSADYADARCPSICPSVCHTPVLCRNGCTY